MEHAPHGVVEENDGCVGKGKTVKGLACQKEELHQWGVISDVFEQETDINMSLF